MDDLSYCYFQTQFYDRKYDRLKSSSILELQPIVESISDQPITPNPSLNPAPDPSLHPSPDPVPTTIPIQAQDYRKEEDDSPDSEPMEDSSSINYDRNQSLCSEQDNEESLADDNNEEFDDDLFCDTEKYESRAPLSEWVEEEGEELNTLCVHNYTCTCLVGKLKLIHVVRICTM